jgi:hypothetical protein
MLFCGHWATFLTVFFGLPTLLLAISQFGCLHFGQRAGLVWIRLTQECPHRRQSHIMCFGIGITLAIIAGFNIALNIF